jgi:hypothetical protein
MELNVDGFDHLIDTLNNENDVLKITIILRLYLIIL